MILPAKGVISQKYNWLHRAIDIANMLDTPVVAPHSGRVTYAGNLGDCGKAVDIGKTNTKSRLCHNNKILVKSGQWVKEGQKVATMGYTGKTVPKGIKGTHVHWVLWINDKRVNGLKYLGDDMYKGKSAKYWYQKYQATKKRRNLFKKWNKANKGLLDKVRSLLKIK